jgi:16S rRNA pseudouridine516 synthase
MSKALGYHVIDLERVAIMTLNLRKLALGELQEGQMRPLTPQETTALKTALVTA